MDVLKLFDLFGTSINFRVFNDQKFHSSFSIILSAFTIIATILFTYFFGLDFIFHTESKILQSTRTSKSYEYYNDLNLDDLFFAWRIEDVYGNEINHTNILFPMIGYYSYKNDEDIKIKHEKCKNFNLSFQIPNDIKEFYCSDISNYSIGGAWENENKIEYFYLNIDVCKDKICPSKKDVFNFLNLYNGLYVVVYYPTISFIPEDKIPYQISYTKKITLLDAELIRVDRFYIRKYIFENDNGWIFKNNKKHELLGISDIET